MKVQLESTTKIVELVINGVTVPARLWEGETEGGVPCFALITRIAPAIKTPELTAASVAEFERDLKEQRQPSPAMQSFPLRMIL